MRREGRTPPHVDRPLLLLDYDGTLAPIAADPAAAFPHPRIPELLRKLQRHHPIRIISGRAVHDLAALLPLPKLYALGVHGMQEGELIEGSEVRGRLGRAEEQLLDIVRQGLPGHDEITVEDKGAAIALHYRGAADELPVVKELERWQDSLPSGLETVWGKKVVEVRPGGFDKGRAALELAHQHPDHTPVMIGDDTTDEDAFRSLAELSQSRPRANTPVTIKVGEGASVADYRLADIDSVVDYLAGYSPQEG